MEQILINVPSDQMAFVTQLLQKLSLEVVHIYDDELTLGQREQLAEALQQAKEGRTITTQQLKEKANRWLTE